MLSLRRKILRTVAEDGIGRMKMDPRNLLEMTGDLLPKMGSTGGCGF